MADLVKLSDYVMRFLVERGVKHVFMLSGGGAMHLNESAGTTPGLEFVANLHEQGAAIAAEAYAQYTNDLGVALVTTGPGGTNAITGLAGAWLDSTPMMVLSGQVKCADLVGDRGVRQFGFQELEICKMVAPITKYAVTIKDSSEIRYHLEKALWLAHEGRPGPVWLDIPLCVQSAMIDPDALTGFTPPAQESPAGLSEQVAEAIRLLNSAERPVVLVGNGVRLAGAVEALLDLLARLNIPTLLTWKTIDFLPEGHPLYAGRPGAIAERGANFAQQNSDWLLAIGARLDLGQTGYIHRYFAREAAKVVVDVDRHEIGKLDMDIAVPVVADAGDFVAEFARQLDAVETRDREPWFARIRDWRKRYPIVLPEYWEQTDYVNTYCFLDVLAEELRDGDVVIPGSSGSCSEVTMQALRLRDGVRVFNTEGLGSMGFAVPAALGGCIASGGKRTITIEGDGSFAMNAQELEVVRRLNLPVKIFILNNFGYASIRASQGNYFDGRLVGADATSGMTLPDTLEIASGYGIPAMRIPDHDGMREKVREVLEIDGPVICELMISPEMQTAPKLSSYQKKDGSMTSRPLEDLAPFLPRDEFLANMIVAPVEE